MLKFSPTYYWGSCHTMPEKFENETFLYTNRSVTKTELFIKSRFKLKESENAGSSFWPFDRFSVQKTFTKTVMIIMLFPLMWPCFPQTQIQNYWGLLRFKNSSGVAWTENTVDAFSYSFVVVWKELTVFYVNNSLNNLLTLMKCFF